jgi:peptidoglycan/LPS O-acetylase OafA/YrhL
MKLAYRPEIDGLRTIAVMLVILHHLGWAALPGGYVGVDVFFVISGYLITAILFAEIRSGEFSVARFYKRRIIRLAPAYFLVLVVASVAAMFFMLPAEILNYAQSVIYSTFFMANFFMWKEVGGYFGAQSDFVPLLHLWSLAVEEQFYIFWPLILFAAYRLLGRRSVLPLVLTVIVVGIAISEWGVQNYRAAAYYLLPTRFFELMVGALLAVVPRFGRPMPVIRELLGITGLALILYAATSYSTEALFPGYAAVVPCIGAALIIYFAQQGQGFVGKFLSLSPMVSVGRISYPAYLWHWPIIAFLNLHLIKIDLIVGTFTLAATLLLSWLTYRYAELPFQRMNALRLPSVLGVGFAAPAVVVLCFGVALKYNDGFPSRFPDSLNLKSAALQSFSNKIRGRCNEGPVDTPLPAEDCILGSPDRQQVDILLIGDSHANHFTGMIDVMAKDAGLRGYDITQSNTIYLPGVKRFYLQDGKVIEHENFLKRNNALQSIIENGAFKYVVLGARFASYLKEVDYFYLVENPSMQGVRVFQTQLEQAIVGIAKSGAIPVFVKGNPTYSSNIQDCTLNNQRFNLKNKCQMHIDEFNSGHHEWSAILEKLAEKYPSIVIIDPAKVVCDTSRCVTELNGVPLYRDGDHLNHLGSKLMGQMYVRKFGNPFKSPTQTDGLSTPVSASLRDVSLTKSVNRGQASIVNSERQLGYAPIKGLAEPSLWHLTHPPAQAAP